MDTSLSTEPRKGSSSPQPGGQLQKAATTSLAAAWLVYRSFLAGPVAQVVPEPTREAVFQLFCDIRANVPKDKRFLQRHAKAFTPRTKIGWLALSGVLGYALSAALLVTTLTLGISVAGLSMGIMAVMATGAFLASALGFMAFVLFTSAFVVGAIAFTALSGYVVGSSSLAVMKHITQLVFGNGPSITNIAAKPGMFSSEEMQQQVNNKSADTTTPIASAAGAATSPVIDSEIETNDVKVAINTPSIARVSTYAAPVAVLPPIKTISPTKKRRSPTPSTSASASAPSSSPPANRSNSSTPSRQISEPSKQEQEAALLSPTSSTSTSTAAKYVTTSNLAAALAADALVEESQINVVSSENNALHKEGERPQLKPTPSPKNDKDKTFVAIKTNKTTPSGTRTITMIKHNDNTKNSTSSPAPLPGPPPSTAGLLKPISRAPSATSATTLDSCAQETSLSISNPLLPSVNSDNKIVSNDSPGAFTSVMQGWKEIEKKAALESPSGGTAKLPLPGNIINTSTKNNRNKNSKGKSSRKSSPGTGQGDVGIVASSQNS